MRVPGGATTTVAVIGDPVTHSLSPAIHNGAFAALDLDWVCTAFHVPPAQLRDAIAGVRGLGLRGVSVTMPHKSAVIEELDELTPAAEALSAVNCIVNQDGHLVGDNTDGPGFLVGLRHDFDLDPAGLDCLVVGAGGAARAVVRSLAEAGADRVRVLNRTAARAAEAASLAGRRGSVADESDVGRVDLVVNATPVGMGGDRGVPFDTSLLAGRQRVAELVYHPATTPLMQAAAERGCATANGLSMLVGQAAVAFAHWTGHEPPVEQMRAAVLQHLASADEN